MESSRTGRVIKLFGDLLEKMKVQADFMLKRRQLSPGRTFTVVREIVWVPLQKLRILDQSELDELKEDLVELRKLVETTTKIVMGEPQFVKTVHKQEYYEDKIDRVYTFPWITFKEVIVVPAPGSSSYDGRALSSRSAQEHSSPPAASRSTEPANDGSIRTPWRDTYRPPALAQAPPQSTPAPRLQKPDSDGSVRMPWGDLHRPPAHAPTTASAPPQPSTASRLLKPDSDGSIRTWYGDMWRPPAPASRPAAPSTNDGPVRTSEVDMYRPQQQQQQQRHSHNTPHRNESVCDRDRERASARTNSLVRSGPETVIGALPSVSTRLREPESHRPRSRSPPRSTATRPQQQQLSRSEYDSTRWQKQHSQAPPKRKRSPSPLRLSKHKFERSLTEVQQQHKT